MTKLLWKQKLTLPPPVKGARGNIGGHEQLKSCKEEWRRKYTDRKTLLCEEKVIAERATVSSTQLTRHADSIYS